MIDKTEVRKILLDKKDSTQRDEDLIENLEKLTIFNSENQLYMERFYTELNEIVSWSEINSIQYFIHEISLNKNMWKIINVLSWSLQSWTKGVQNADINKVVISYLIAERLYLLPEKDLSWDEPFEKLKDHLAKFLPAINFDVNYDLPEYASYSDKKFHSDYKKAVEDQNYRCIFLY